MVTITQLSEAQFRACTDDFAVLLIDAVEHGGSVSFVPPLPHEKARLYWLGVADSVEAGTKQAWAAFDGDRLVGCVLLDFAQQDNGRHRGEVQKMLVHSAYRGQGIAKRLMAAMEDGARAAKLTLLVLDTEKGGPGEQLYTRIGYQRAGEIPHFALLGDGSYCTTVYFYRLLHNAAAETNAAQ